jgi:acyl-CoA synthetase (NDP forming)
VEGNAILSPRDDIVPGRNRPLSGTELLATLFEPRSVAIVGASTDPQSMSGRPLDHLVRHGYKGTIYLVNPNRPEIAGRPTVPSLADVPPESVDVALVAVGAARVADAVEQVAQAGVPCAVVLATGLSERDNPHRIRIDEIVRESGLRLVGPNSLGLLWTRSSGYLTPSSLVNRSAPKTGSIGLVTQSGAMGNVLLQSVLARGAGVAGWVSTGDEVDVGALEVASALLLRDEVTGVGLFLEGLGDLDWLEPLADAIEATKKPVYVLKGAQTASGADAAAGHTGRVVGAADASLAILREAGMQVVPTAGALGDALVVRELIGSLKGGRIGVVTTSGGAGVLTADAVERSAALTMSGDVLGDPGLRAKVGGRVSAISNPLDVAGSDVRIFSDWANAFASPELTDAVIAIESALIHDEHMLARELRAGAGTAPIVVVPVCEDEPVERAVALELADAGIAVIPSAERAVAALDLLPREEGGPAVPEPHADHGAGHELMGLEAAVEILGEDLPWAEFAVAPDSRSGAEAASRLGFPVALKAAGRTLHHRSEAGAVRIGVDEAHFAEAFAEVAAAARAAGDVVLVQEQVAAGFEVMISVVNDRELGPVAYVRPGGVLAELMDDQAVVWSGWNGPTRRFRLTASKAGRILSGYRGGRAYDVDALGLLVDALLTRVTSANLAFVELNPVIVSADGIRLVDALVATTPGGTA